jgi:anti-sigma factor RsiW
MSAQVTEADLHGYVDGVLSSERMIALKLISRHIRKRHCAYRAWQEQNQALHAAFDPVLSELLPASTRPRPWFRHIPFVRYAAVAVC